MDTRSELMCGTLAGLAGAAVDYPLDTVKTRMQLFSGLEYRGYAHCTTHMLRHEGILSFYKGVSIPLLAQGIENAVLFSVFRASLPVWTDLYARLALPSSLNAPLATTLSSPQPSSVPLLLAAGSAGVVVSFVLTPVEYLKCNMQAENSLPALRRAHHGLSSFVCWSLRTRGVFGFYRGFTGTLARAVPGNMAYFYTYTTLKARLHRGQISSPSRTPSHEAPSEHQKRWWHATLAGGLSGCAYWTVMFPADVVKTRMQVDPAYAAMGYRRTCAVQVRQLGLRSLYSGWCVTAVRSFVSSAVVFTVYEHCAKRVRHDTLQLQLCP